MIFSGRDLDEMDIQLLGMLMVLRLTDEQILAWGRLRVRARHVDTEQTVESARLHFTRYLWDTGRISGDDTASETTIEKLNQTIDIAGPVAISNPHYSGGR